MHRSKNVPAARPLPAMTCSQPHRYASAAQTVGVRSSTRDEMSVTDSILRTVFSIADWRSSEMTERVRLRYLSWHVLHLTVAVRPIFLTVVDEDDDDVFFSYAGPFVNLIGYPLVEFFLHLSGPAAEPGNLN